jgi:hypothetical protein
MQTYINYLIEDIINAERTDGITTDHSTEKQQTFEEYIAEVERYLEQNPARTFSYYCGLNKEQFPPAEKLSEEQILQISKAFKHLLFTWNLDVSIPESIPSAKYYSLLISVLDEKTEIVDSGIITFEFCNYDPPSCPFEGYCSCKDFELDNKGSIGNYKHDGDWPL